MKIKWKKRARDLHKGVLEHLCEKNDFPRDAIAQDIGYTALEDTLEFPQDSVWFRKKSLIVKAINNIKGMATENATLSEIFLDELNKLYNAKTSSRSSDYYLLSGLSIIVDDLNAESAAIRIGDADITFYRGDLPSDFDSDESTIQLMARKYGLNVEEYKDKEAEKYTKVVIKVKSIAPEFAAYDAIFYLDCLRGLLNLEKNPLSSDSSALLKPINSIRSSAFFVMYDKSHKVVHDLHIWDRNYVTCIRPVSMSINQIFSLTNEFTQKVNVYQNKSKKEFLLAISDYARALDECDVDAALVKLWSILERLLGFENTYDKIIKRCASMYKDDKKFHETYLTCVKEVRNLLVHGRHENVNTRIYCEYLQRLFKHLIGFYIANEVGFYSIREANEYLDLPRDIETLQRRAKHVKHAISSRCEDDAEVVQSPQNPPQ